MGNLEDASMLDEFTARGRWWTESDKSDVVAGELSFSPSHIRQASFSVPLHARIGRQRSLGHISARGGH